MGRTVRLAYRRTANSKPDAGALRGPLPLLVVPEGGDQVNRHFEREARIGTFRSLKAALNSAKTFLDSNIWGDDDDVSENASR